MHTVRPIGCITRVVEYFRAERALTWDRPPDEIRVSRLRKTVRHRLGDRRSGATTAASLAPDDARWLIAREEGFERWDDLVGGAEP